MFLLKKVLIAFSLFRLLKSQKINIMAYKFKASLFFIYMSFSFALLRINSLSQNCVSIIMSNVTPFIYYIYNAHYRLHTGTTRYLIVIRTKSCVIFIVNTWYAYNLNITSLTQFQHLKYNLLPLVSSKFTFLTIQRQIFS